MLQKTLRVDGYDVPVICVNTVIVGSGAAGLSCADHLYNMGQTDIAIVTEKLGGGTSNNTGSDKQTYYKLDLAGADGDSPYEMAKTLFDGGAMHGDIALIESICSAQAFYRLVQIGVPFPHNELGAFIGYKTDHDPRQRATSAGPWTSSQMVQCLRTQVKKNNIPIFDDTDVISLLVDDHRVCGLVALQKSKVNEPGFGLLLMQAENVVFAVGGPGGLYQTSVYPQVHVGAIGIALQAGAKAVNLTESQYGLASIDFRWNVSGTYQQVIPRYFSTDADGNDPQDFLNAYFDAMPQLAQAIFLKGYQWPFDPRKIADHGSSLIDILVYIETVIKKRCVFLDFRENPRSGHGLQNFSLEELPAEAKTYLQNSNAMLATPYERLLKMNPMAIELYRQNGIDLQHEPLQIAVCAQHNNGGLAGDIWWESNLRHLFPIGEVNGTHGVYRPGGSALNSGQVGALRAAQRIAHVYKNTSVDEAHFNKLAIDAIQQTWQRIAQLLGETETGIAYRQELQQRMTDFGSHIRDGQSINAAVQAASTQWKNFVNEKISQPHELAFALQNQHLALAHLAYLSAIEDYITHGGGSRGSYLVTASIGEKILAEKLPEWIYQPENADLREQVQEIWWDAAAEKFQYKWQPRRPIPQKNEWFENVWQAFQQGDIFKN